MQAVLLDLVNSGNLKSVSVVGMAKNTGKTVVFNRLVQEAAGQGLVPGLTSIGRDGEKSDAVYHLPKPRIFAPAGSFLATARDCLTNSEAGVEVLHGTGFFTPLGEVLIGRVAAPGFVELAGPVPGSQQREVIRALMGYGADLVLVDGALDRVSSAAPSLAQGTILSTGAALGAAIPDVLAKTRDQVERFGLPAAGDGSLELGRSLMNHTRAALINRSGGIRALAVKGSMVAGDLIYDSLAGDIELVVLAGAVGNIVLKALTEGMARAGISALNLVIKNGTCLLADRSVWQGFMAAGGSISVVESIRLLAVTVNPFSPTGPGFAPEKFLAAAGEALSPCPVADVVLGKRYHPEAAEVTLGELCRQ